MAFWVRNIGISLLVVLVVSSATKVGWWLYSIAPGMENLDADTHSKMVRNYGLLFAGVIGLLLAIWRSIVASQQARIANRQAEISNRQADTAERGQVTNRFSKAVEQLAESYGEGDDAEPNLTVRIGAIYALGRIAKDSPEDAQTVFDVLSSYVRAEFSVKHVEPVLASGAKTDEPKQSNQDAPEARSDLEAVATVCRNVLVLGTPIRVNYFATDLSRTNLAGTYLRGAKLNNADLRGAKLANANLTNANLANANLSNADFTNADLTNADLSGVDLSEADLIEATLKGALLIRAKLSEADLTGADLTEANLIAVSMEGANLTEAILTNANLSNANLSNADLANANLTNADLTGADLSEADLTGVDLSEADLTGADPSGVKGWTC